MSAPFTAGRDSGNPGFVLNPQADINDEHLGSFRESFQPPSDRLSEQDYRQPGGRAPNTELGATADRTPRQEPSRFTYPSVSREPKAT